MQKGLLFLLIIFVFAKGFTHAQNSYLLSDDPMVHLLDKLETKSGFFSNDLFLSNKPLNRKAVYNFLVNFQPENYNSDKSVVDNFLIFREISKNGEWKPRGDAAQFANHAVGPFYKTVDHLLYIHKPSFFAVIDPVLGFEVSQAIKPQKMTRFSHTEGLKTRARIGDFLGMNFQFTHNDWQPMAFEHQHITRWQAVPGVGKFHSIKHGYGYWDIEGNLNTEIIKDHISLDAGYGRHFIGDGIRSLFLSDNAGSSVYVGINTKVWHLNYQNLFLRLNPQSFPGEPANPGEKYAAVHYLSVNLRPWLNLGLFETTVFSRNGGYDLAYMNPIIFYRSVERSLGSPDKVSLGFSAKAIVARRVQFYSQFLLNEFTAKYFFKRSGYWANKWGLQGGVKYFDAFGIPDLYLQGEINMVRPYTYSHSQKSNGLPIENFTSWNQPLAHPLGAGFRELLGIVGYHPIPKLAIEARVMYYQQGNDTGGLNLGNNIFISYNTPKDIFGVRMIHGPKTSVFMGNIYLSYQIRANLFLYGEGNYRHSSTQDNIQPRQNDVYFNLGFRLNLERNLRNWY